MHLAMKGKKDRRDGSQSDHQIVFPTGGGGAAQVPYGNAPVIPTGLEGRGYMRF